MTDVLDLIQNINNLKVDRLAKQSIARTSKIMADLNREQLQSGKRADNSTMPNYSAASVKIFGKPAGPIKLYDTGAFHDSIQIDVGSDEIEFLAKDEHKLIERYTDEVLGLGDKQQEYYNEEIFYPEFAEEIEKETGLKFS